MSLQVAHVMLSPRYTPWAAVHCSAVRTEQVPSRAQQAPVAGCGQLAVAHGASVVSAHDLPYLLPFPPRGLDEVYP